MATVSSSHQGHALSLEIELIPWDPESIEHVQRLYDQRIACGWNSNLVELWRTKQREGKKAIHWIVLTGKSVETKPYLTQHISQWPKEKCTILDSATSLQAKSRTPRLELHFIPVGHISLDSENADSSLADASQGLYCITTFYISRPLQSIGLGRSAMDAVEKMAAEEPLQAKALALDTVAREELDDLERWKAYGKPIPSAPVQDWYERRGYHVYKYEKDLFYQGNIGGKVWALDAVFLKKILK